MVKFSNRQLFAAEEAGKASKSIQGLMPLREAGYTVTSVVFTDVMKRNVKTPTDVVDRQHAEAIQGIFERANKHAVDESIDYLKSVLQGDIQRQLDSE